MRYRYFYDFVIASIIIRQMIKSVCMKIHESKIRVP